MSICVKSCAPLTLSLPRPSPSLSPLSTRGPLRTRASGYTTLTQPRSHCCPREPFFGLPLSLSLARSLSLSPCRFRSLFSPRRIVPELSQQGAQVATGQCEVHPPKDRDSCASCVRWLTTFLRQSVGLSSLNHHASLSRQPSIGLLASSSKTKFSLRFGLPRFGAFHTQPVAFPSLRAVWTACITPVASLHPLSRRGMETGVHANPLMFGVLVSF